MLLLFDIDGTLLLTQKAGIRAMGDAGRELFGQDFTYDGVEFSGRLDPLIWQDLAAVNGVEHEAHHLSFRQTYARFLATRLADGSCATALPGVLPLLEGLRDIDHVTLGLLTGNYPETGQLKLRSAGIDPEMFSVRAWGVDGTHRRHLPQIAMQRYVEKKGVSLPFESVVIIGDTPHDVDCGRAHSCRVLGVGTGAFAVEELIECGADLAVPDLSDTRAVMSWLLSTTCCPDV